MTGGVTMSNFIRTLVSKEKKRFEEGEYNLDLSYITDRIIAMGFPASSFEAIYRNSLEDVKKFLEDKHKDRYRLYNLCSERSYDIGKFQNRVAFYPFDDHNPPEFNMMKPFCEDVDRWLAEDKENIAVVHCKAGKGRTGLMICAYLLHTQHQGMTTSDQVLKFYAEKRTQNDKGVTIPSQRRYVDYYAAMIKDRLQFSPVKLYLHSFVIDPVPNLGLNQSDSFITFEVRQKHIRQYISEVYQVKKTDSPITIKLREPLLLIDDVRIDVLLSPDFFGSKKYTKFPKFQKLKFHFWVNTYFIDQERSSDLSHEIGETSAEQLFHLSTTPSSVCNPVLLHHRSSHLAHESLASRPSLPAASPTSAGSGGSSAGGQHHHQRMMTTSTTASLTANYHHQSRMTTSVIGTTAPTVSEDSPSQDRKCRSEHNSGEMGGGGGSIGGCGGNSSSPVPFQTHLRQQHNANDMGSGASSHAAVTHASDDALDTRSPNGSFVPNLESIPSFRIPRNVTLVDPAHQGEPNCDIMKSKCVSDDTLTDQNPLDATQSAFNNDHDHRKRHRSVPMMGKTGFGGGFGGGGGGPSVSRTLQGKMMSVRLKKHQIDDADKDKGKRFADQFHVTLFLIRPSNQTLQEEFLRPNSIAQHADHRSPSSYQHPADTNRIPPYSRYSPPDDDSSEEEDDDDELDDEFDDIRRADAADADISVFPPSPSSAPAGGMMAADLADPDTDTLAGADSVSTASETTFQRTGSDLQPATVPAPSYLTAASTEALPSAMAEPVTVGGRRQQQQQQPQQQQLQETDTQPVSGMVRNQTDPCRELCRVSSQTTWI